MSRPDGVREQMCWCHCSAGSGNKSTSADFDSPQAIAEQSSAEASLRVALPCPARELAPQSKRSLTLGRTDPKCVEQAFQHPAEFCLAEHGALSPLASDLHVQSAHKALSVDASAIQVLTPKVIGSLCKLPGPADPESFRLPTTDPIPPPRIDFTQAQRLFSEDVAPERFEWLFVEASPNRAIPQLPSLELPVGRASLESAHFLGLNPTWIEANARQPTSLHISRTRTWGRSTSSEEMVPAPPWLRWVLALICVSSLASVSIGFVLRHASEEGCRAFNIAGALVAVTPCVWELGKDSTMPPGRFRCVAVTCTMCVTALLLAVVLLTLESTGSCRHQTLVRLEHMGISMGDAETAVPSYCALVVVRALTLCVATVPAAVCFCAQHPPSHLARSSVHCAMLLWAQACVCALNVAAEWCADVPEAAAWVLDFMQHFTRGIAGVWSVACIFWLWVLVRRRLNALDVETGFSFARYLQVTLYVALASGASSIPAYFVGVRILHASGWFLAAGCLVVGMGLSSAAFCYPIWGLLLESQRTIGAPKAEAWWAIRTLSKEVVAVAVSVVTSLVFVAMQARWSLSDGRAYSAPGYVPAGLANAADILGNVCAVPVMSGVLQTTWRARPPSFAHWKRPALVESIMDLKREPSEQDAGWRQKVEDLAHRGVDLESLLNFYAMLLKGDTCMPHFDAERSTTSDVARQAIIPMSKLPDGSGGVALSVVLNMGRPVLAEKMVTHSWCNTFTHLIAAIVADGLGKNTYHEVAALLVNGRVSKVKGLLDACGTLKSTYWVCAFCVNQHEGICNSFGTEPVVDTREWHIWESKRRDSITGEPYVACDCLQPKFLNENPNQCEMNKFDDMMVYLKHEREGFEQVVAVDTRFALLKRAWCLAELVEADKSKIPQRLLLHSDKAIEEHYKHLKILDVRQSQASRIEDKLEIIRKIKDIEAFNELLRWLIFSETGLMTKWMDAESRLTGVGRVAGRVLQRVSEDEMTLTRSKARTSLVNTAKRW